MRQLSKQRSFIEQQLAAEEEETEQKKDVLIVEEKAETGSVSGLKILLQLLLYNTVIMV